MTSIYHLPDDATPEELAGLAAERRELAELQTAEQRVFWRDYGDLDDDDLTVYDNL